MEASSAAVKTFPHGFIGEFNRIALVFGPNAAASAERGNSQCGGDNRTMRGIAPSRRTIGT